MFFTTSLKALAIVIFCTTLKVINAATWTPLSSSVVRIPNNGARFYINNGGQLQELSTVTANTTNPPSFDTTWRNATLDFTPFGVSNVAPSSTIASVSYIFEGLTKTKVFYQTTDGSIRAVMCCQTPEWGVDPTIIATAPLGVDIQAFQASDTTGTAIVFVSWQNALGQLTERWTADVIDVAPSWSAPVIIST
ncbi:hypothetical protein K438DRAFT_2070798 [Mycena galopus ATCC 62051]|nr:hypothetical protein K438DRAFT_2070798 [Mycena galopus ATCC 62051]